MYYFSNLEQINNFLMNKNNYNFFNYFYSPRYKLFFLSDLKLKNNSLRIEEFNNNSLRIEEFNNKHIFDCTSRPVGGIDLIVKKDIVLIDYFFMNDVYFYKELKMYGKPMSDSDASDMRKLLLSYAKNIAVVNDIKIIQRDVHYNLENYNSDFINNNFVLSNERADDNPFWIKTYKYL
jgi:hypothetical protein